MTDQELLERLRAITQKWISQARHPQRMDKPGERDLIMRHVADVEGLAREIRDGG